MVAATAAMRSSSVDTLRVLAEKLRSTPPVLVETAKKRAAVAIVMRMKGSFDGFRWVSTLSIDRFSPLPENSRGRLRGISQQLFRTLKGKTPIFQTEFMHIDT